MAFLEDLGRSNALSSVNNLMGKAIEMRQGEDKSAERAYTMGLQAEELGIHKAAAEREATKFKFEADAMQEKQRLQDIPYPVAKYLGADFANDPAKKMMYEKAKELGIIENIGGIDMAREKNFPAFKKYMMDDPEWTANLNATNMAKLQKQAAELELSIPEMKKPEEQAAAKKQLGTIYEQIGGLAKTQMAIDTEHQKKKELEKTKAEGKLEGIQIGADAKLEAAKVAADARVEAANARAEAAKEATAAKAKKELSFADKEALRSMGKQLPKSKTLAETASKNIVKIDRMLGLIDKGAGGVKGELLAKINKVADVFRATSPEDAKYNTLKAELRSLAGTLRVQLGLIGQTSDRDVAIMYEAAGGMSPAESQRAILNGYKQGYAQDITNYNSDAEAYGEYSKAGKDLYRPIKAQEAGGGVQVVETRKTKDGRTLEKLSDGTIREKK